MKINDIQNPIAHRTLKTNLGEDVFVVMGSPEPFEDERDFFCPYSIEFKNSSHYGYAGGVDAFQAMQLCMYRIGIVLQSMFENDGLHWLTLAYIGWMARQGSLAFLSTNINNLKKNIG